MLKSTIDRKGDTFFLFLNSDSRFLAKGLSTKSQFPN